MPTIEQSVGDILRTRHLTISTAESCTGGRLAALLNRRPGSSDFYMGSVIAYSNDVKERLLGVSPDTLRTVGAVSEETVLQMVTGVRNLIRTDCAIATSGIAGPGGGSIEKPVGTVWMAWATPVKTCARCFHFDGSREQIASQAAETALQELLQLL